MCLLARSKNILWLLTQATFRLLVKRRQGRDENDGLGRKGEVSVLEGGE